MPEISQPALTSSIPDAALVARATRGDADAFRQLVERHERRVSGFACRLLGGDTTTAEDITQEVWIALWQALRTGRYQERGLLSAYLFRAVRNRCHDLARAARPTVPLAEADATVAPGGTGDVVRDTIALLPDAQRVALLLHYYEGASYEEIAGVLNCATGTVASRLHAARATLKRLLTEETDK